MTDFDALGVLGLPGAGKTTAAKYLSEERKDVYFLAMSDVAYSVFEDVMEDELEAFGEEMRCKIKDSDYDSEDVIPKKDNKPELGRFAGVILDIENTYFSSRAVEHIQEQGVDKVVVDGIRSVSDVYSFTNASDGVEFVYIHSPFSVRLERIRTRGRKGEGDLGVEELIERDSEELGWGVDEILEENQPEMFYNNFDSVKSFKKSFLDYVEAELYF